MKLSKDDKIRQHATQQLRTYWEINFKEFNEMFEINTKEYFKKEIESLNEMVQDGIVTVNDDAIRITELGKDLAQFITNRFDAYDPPDTTYNERLAVIKNAKEEQKKFLNYVSNL